MCTALLQEERLATHAVEPLPSLTRPEHGGRCGPPVAAGRGDGDGSPAVVMISANGGGEAFEQLSCTLRRRGMRVVMVAAGDKARRPPMRRLTGWLRDRAIYDAIVDVSELGEEGSLPERLGRIRILDVLADENALAGGGSNASPVLALARRGLAYRRYPPERLVDKFDVNAILEKSGVRIPPQIGAAEISPAQAAARLGLPLVVKARTGAGGAGVRIANSVAEIERSLEELSGNDPSTVFYQKYVDGELVMCGIVAGPEGPLLEHGFAISATRSPLGPSAQLRLDDDPALLMAGRLAAVALGFLGLADLGFIRDAQGELWHVDANCRCWGNMLSLLGAGIDYSEAYLGLLLGQGSQGRAPTSAARRRGEIAVLPFMLYEAVSHGPLRRIISLAAQFGTFCRHGPGAFYGLVIFTRACRRLVLRGLRAVFGRGRSQAIGLRKA